jgi:hypothetical protein
VVRQECAISVGHLYQWALGVVERCSKNVLRSAPGQLKGKKKHHDTISDMIAASSLVLSSVSRGGTQLVYGGRLFVVSARTNKRHHHHHRMPGRGAPCRAIFPALEHFGGCVFSTTVPISGGHVL